MRRYSCSLALLGLLLLTACSSDRTCHEDEVIVRGRSPAKRRCLIVIDAGHGGKDLGANSEKRPRYEEKTFTLRTAKYLECYLQHMGYDTLMTRTADRFIGLSERAAFANQHGADYFVSVHYNAAPNKEAHGVEVYYFHSEKNKGRSQIAKNLAQSTLDAILSQTSAKSRGVKHGNLAVLRETKMTAILVEGGFLTNGEELKKLKATPYLRKIAHGIAQGIDHYHCSRR